MERVQNRPRHLVRHISSWTENHTSCRVSSMKLRAIFLSALVLLLCGLGWYFTRTAETVSEDSGESLPPVETGSLHSSTKPSAVERTAVASAPANKAKPKRPPIPLTQAQMKMEANKAIDRDHLQKLRVGVLAYKEKHGHYPEYLSQLVPEFVSADTLVSPNGSSHTAKGDHPDPGVATPYYGYEFSNLEFRDGRTFAEIKEIQRSEWGDVVPMLRYFGYDKVLNCSCRGDVFETELNWEWDPATLDVVDKYGWGPGLKVGLMVDVKVVDPNGQPLPNARVWADGRNYSFDLPDRPYITDSEGNVKMPIGADPDRTALRLRTAAEGVASPTTSFARGDVPQNQTLTTSHASEIGGQVVDADGYAVPNVRLALRTRIPGDEKSERYATIGQVVTDENGNWSSAVHPDDAKNFVISTAVSGPHGNGYGANGNITVDHSQAAKGKAVVTLPGKK